MKGIIGIASAKDEIKNPQQLPMARIYVTEDGRYLFLESSVITKAIVKSWEKLETGHLSLVLIEVQFVPISQRVTRKSDRQ